jgi:hypothetical protein
MKAEKGIELIGPIPEQYEISFNGYIVPRLTAKKLIGGDLELFLDRRFSIELTQAEAAQVVWFVANAMAVVAGYSSHGEHSQPLNPYRVGCVALRPEHSPDDEGAP